MSNSVWTNQQSDEAIKRLMTDLGTHESMSLYKAFKQLENEIVQSAWAALEEKGRQLKAWRASALMLGEDLDTEEKRNKELKNYTAELEQRLQQPALADVMAERQRQVSAEGWTLEDDDQYQDNELACAAATYAAHWCWTDEPPSIWPWAEEWWKPSKDVRRNMVKAGALILAEIERLDRAAAKVEG